LLSRRAAILGLKHHRRFARQRSVFAVAARGWLYRAKFALFIGAEFGVQIAALLVLADSLTAPTFAAPAIESDGVKFRMVGSAYLDPPPRKSTALNVVVDVMFQISAHAREQNFYGRVTKRFQAFSGEFAPPEQLIWEETSCHQRRGLPKLNVMSIKGSAAEGEQVTKIAARPRHLGKLLPEDEITPSVGLRSGSDERGRYFTYRAATTRSRLFIDVKIYMIDCALTQ
jgi:hypothetical protein